MWILSNRFNQSDIPSLGNKEKDQERVLFLLFQPVGFVTFHTRAGAEAAKQDLQVNFVYDTSTTVIIILNDS